MGWVRKGLKYEMVWNDKHIAGFTITGGGEVNSIIIDNYLRNRCIKKARFGWKFNSWDFPGYLVVRTSLSKAGGVGLIPSWADKISQALQPKNHKTEAIL